jgi:uncharacterized membrane protein YhhN
LPADATHGDGGGAAAGRVARAAVVAAVLGVLATWTSADGVRLDGVEGPNNGWLVLVLAVLALAWTRPLARGSRVGIVGVAGAGVAMAWTALESWLDGRAVLGASAGVGLLLVLAASVALVGAAVARAAVPRAGEDPQRRPEGGRSARHD